MVERQRERERGSKPAKAGAEGGRVDSEQLFLARISVKIQSDAAQRVQDLPGRL